MVWDTELRWLLDSPRLSDLRRAATIAMAFPTLLTVDERDALNRRGARITEATHDLVDAVNRFSPHRCMDALNRGADLEATDLNNGAPFLYTLCTHKTGSMMPDSWFDSQKFSVACRMIDMGARVDDVDRITGRTPLHEAAHWGFRLVVHELLVNGADPRVPDRAGRTPFTESRSGGCRYMFRRYM